MPEKLSLFKSPEGESQYFAAYDSAMELWLVPHEEMEVPTTFGITHINVAGPKDAPPIFMFPGFGSNSTMWYANIGEISKYFRAYAVDTIGQPGKSLPARPVIASNSNEWIVEILDKLSIEKAHMIGVSLGGWLVLNFGINHPERTEKNILLDPAASFAKLSSAFFWHSLIPVMIYPTRSGLVRFFKWMTQGYQVNPQFGEMMLLGILNTRPQPPIRATVFSNMELGQMKNKVLLLVGDRSVLYNPLAVVDRAKALIQNAEAEIVQDAAHSLIMEQAAFVNQRILKFLTG
jgi:pimeloyl-ACP methyl ester carboxylesterase